MMDPKAFFKLTYGLYVVGVRDGDMLGGCVVDAVMQTTVSPPGLVICCGRTTWTHDCIKKTKEFTLSVLPADADPFIIGNFGFQSRRNVDKWKNVDFHLMDGLPVLDEAAAYLFCRVIETKELSTHTLFFCEIADALDGPAKALSYTEYQESWKPRVLEAFKAGKPSRPSKTALNTDVKGENKMKYKWVCKVCGYVYDGDTPFEELPDDYVCPLCGVPKSEFEKVEEKE